MEQNIITFEKALKECYLPVWQNQLNVEPAAFLSKVKSVPLEGEKIVASAPIGLSGGFGFGEEGKATPEAGGVSFERFITGAKDMYCNIAISVKAVRVAKGGAAMANALDTEVRAAYETAKWNVGRALFGNGSGKLCKVVSASGDTITVDNIKNLKEGLIVDFYGTNATTRTATGRIKAINRVAAENGNYTITLYKVPTETIGAGFMTVQNSYNNEITGLGAIFDDSISTIYGVSKSANPYLKPIVYDGGNDISDGLITKALRMASREKGSNVDMLMMGDNAYDNYVTYLRENNIRVESRTGQIEGGFKAIKFLFGNHEVDIVNESFVPDDETWGIDTSAWEFHKQEWDFANLQGGGIFNLMEDTSVYRALLANYGNLICKNPGGSVRIANCA